MGSINQKVVKLLFDLFFVLSSDTKGIFGVIFVNLSLKILLTSISPFVTGVLSSLYSVMRPSFLISTLFFPAKRKVSIKL